MQRTESTTNEPAAPSIPRYLVGGLVAVLGVHLFAAAMQRLTQGYSFVGWLLMPIREFTSDHPTPNPDSTWITIALFIGVMACLHVLRGPLEDVKLFGRTLIPEADELLGVVLHLVSPQSSSPHGRNLSWFELCGIVAGVIGSIVIAIIAVAYVLGLVTFGLGLLLRTVGHYDFVASALLVSGTLAVPLRPAARKLQCWKRLEDIWTKVPSTGSFGILTLGALETVAKADPRFSSFGLDRGQLTHKALGILFAVAVLAWVVGHLTTTAGRASAPDDDSRVPALMFFAAFSSLWLANVGIYTLFVDGIILTLRFHLLPGT